MRTLSLLFFTAGLFVNSSQSSMALPAQPVPIPEDPSIAPQVNISGAGIGALGYGKTPENRNTTPRMNFSDTALQVGALD
jgi:hypothetical protein